MIERFSIDEAIYESNKIICRQISRLGQSTRGEVSQEVIESLCHFVEHILLKVYANGSDIEDTRENIQKAVKFAKNKIKLLHIVYMQSKKIKDLRTAYNDGDITKTDLMSIGNALK